ncbi:MAG: polyprenyl diphosphate synthase [Pseudohongiellaceae bacterium]
MKAESLPAVPRHVAIIMDGNNRWAKVQGLASKAGHRQGAEAARHTVDACIERGISYLTLFAFSSENWLRPAEEVQGLMALFLSVLKRKEVKQFHEKNVRIRFVGDRSSFSSKLQSGMADVEKLTESNSGLTVIVAASYGGRWDITQAAKELAAKVVNSELSIDEISPELLAKQLSLNDVPDPDLCIRTGGEQRVSNFLLWQFAYTELYFSEVFWPDFGDAHLDAALSDYALRQRRFGGHHEGDGGEC